MTTEYSPFARPKFTAEDFARTDDTGQFDAPPTRSRVDEPRSFMTDLSAQPVDREVSANPAALDPVMEAELAREDEMLLDRPVERDAPTETPIFAAAPLYAGGRTKASTSRGIPKAALIAVPAAVLLAGAGYMALNSQGENTGIAQKAPGAPAEAPAVNDPATLAAATPAPMSPAATPTPAPAPTEVAQAPRASARVEAAPTRVARARPAPAPAATASSAGVDASATLPAAPVPYSATAQAPSAAPPTIVVPPPMMAEPVNPAPAPAAETPQTPTPEAIEPPTQ